MCRGAVDQGEDHLLGKSQARTDANVDNHLSSSQNQCRASSSDKPRQAQAFVRDLLLWVVKNPSGFHSCEKNKNNVSILFARHKG